MKRRSSLRLRRPNPMGRSCSAVGGFSTVATSCLLVCPVLVFGSPLDRGDDVLVARTAADRARGPRADLLVGRLWVLVEQRPRRHQHPGRTEAALERVLLMEALLDRVELPVLLERFDGADLVALAHRRKCRARLERLAVHEDDACAAVGGVAAPMRTGQPGRVADEVHEERARLDIPRPLLTVDVDRQLHGQTSCPPARTIARLSARFASTPARWRL